MSDERIQVNAAGQVELELKTPRRDGSRRCPRCGGVQVKIIAAIPERAVIGKILTHPGWILSRRRAARHARRGSSSQPEWRGPTRALAPWRAAAGVQPE
jgi:hypothetical protein